MSKYKFTHKTIIDQYDYMNLVEELAWKLFDTVLENQSENREEYIIYDLEEGDTFTQKGEDVFAGFSEDIENLIKTRLQLEYHRNDREWRSKEELLEKPF